MKVKVKDEKLFGREVVLPCVQKVSIPKNGIIEVTKEHGKELQELGIVELLEGNSSTVSAADPISKLTDEEVQELIKEYPEEETKDLKTITQKRKFLSDKLS